MTRRNISDGRDGDVVCLNSRLPADRGAPRRAPAVKATLDIAVLVVLIVLGAIVGAVIARAVLLPPTGAEVSR